MKKINIVQFLPYFPPHKWGLETHAKQFWEKYVENSFWNVINVITSFNQENKITDNNKIIFEWKTIWYKENGVENLIVPSFEIIPNFPMYKIWTKEFKSIEKYLKTKNIDIVITRTRFFLTSFIWWIFTKKNEIKWVHIEHGSDYVKLSSNFKNIIAKIYDKIIWKWIFKKVDLLVWVSNACKNFIQKEFVNRNVEVIYRWINIKDVIEEENLKEKFPWKIIIWFVWRLYKWKNVEGLIKAYYELNNKTKEKIQIIIVWDGEDAEKLKKLDIENKMYFTWWKNFEKALWYQKQFDIHFHTSNPWWGLATTVLQAMYLWCFIVATPYEWANEIIENWKNWILLKYDSVEEIKRWIIEWINSLNKKEEYAKINKKIIEEIFNWDKNIRKYYNLFNKILEWKRK